MGGRMTKMMMMPGEGTLVRVPTKDMPRVAIAQLRQINYFEQTTTNANFFNYEYIAFVYGQPGLTYIDGPFVTSEELVCACNFHEPTLTDQKTNFWALGQHFSHANTEPHTYWPLVGMTNVTQPEGIPKYRPVLNGVECKYIFLNAGEKLKLSVSGTHTPTTPVTELHFSMWRHTSDGAPIHASTFNMAATAGGIHYQVAAVAGWYAVRFDHATNVVDMAATIGVTMTAVLEIDLPHYRLHYVNEIGNRDLGASCRRTSYSFLLTNRSNALVAEGDVLSARLESALPGTRQWPLTATKLAAAKDKFSGAAPKGCYTYMEFTEWDEAFRDYAGETYLPSFYDNANMMNVVTINNRGTNPNQYTIVEDIVLEFRTQSQLFATSVSEMDFNELVVARRINNMTSYFYENPLHWQDIINYIRAAWALTRKHATTLGTAASIAFPEAAPAIMPMARYLQT